MNGVAHSSPDADLIVIGAGPAGMSAAVTVARAGFKVIVLDMQPTPGGQIFRSLETNVQAKPETDELLRALGPAYLQGKELIERFRATSGIDFRPLTTVWELRADGTVGWLNGERAGYLRGARILVANGAMERPLPFPGWTLPGVMTAGAVQTLLKAGRLRPKGQIVLAGTGPLIFLLADQLRQLGVRPQLIARTDTFRQKLRAIFRLRFSAIPAIVKGMIWIAKLRLAGVQMCTGATGLVAAGHDCLESVSVTISGKRHQLPCDLLIVHDGIVPSTDLAHSAGLAMEWQACDSSWRPKTSHDGQAEQASKASLTEGPCLIRISGDARRIGGADAAIAHGKLAGHAIVNELDGQQGQRHSEHEREVLSALAARPFIDAAFPRGISAELPSDDTIVCRCEEITAGQLRQTIRNGSTDMNHLRGVLRCGMGPCQGRSCTVTLARLMQEAGVQPPSSASQFRERPPVRPLPLGALATMTGLDPALATLISLDDKPAVASEAEDA
ncbi:FAD-dependent oxidoreductase [Pseudomonas sp. NPDC089734]|uniref:FAD-dependent oxidoreductase n=1 Tax=Pseudomonas sp. NPDC089734 TaxID=3364469 RepID=UPI00381E8EFA